MIFKRINSTVEYTFRSPEWMDYRVKTPAHRPSHRDIVAPPEGPDGIELIIATFRLGFEADRYEHLKCFLQMKSLMKLVEQCVNMDPSLEAAELRKQINKAQAMAVRIVDDLHSTKV